MTNSNDEQFNVQWDILQEGDNNLIDPLSDIKSDNEPAILPSQSYVSESTHVDIDILDNTFDMQHPAVIKEYTNGDTEPTTTPINIIKVTDPRKETEQQSTFISYLVQSKNKQVRRRFQDFVWLHNVLYAHFPACFVPPLPDKHRLEYVKGDRFSSDFTEKRRISLEIFVQRIARHPVLYRSELFTMFLESSEFNDASARALRESQETVMDTIGDSLLNAFSKIRKPDPRFVEMKERNDRMAENLDMLQKTLLRTNKRTEDLCSDYKEFTENVRGLSDLEPSYKIPLDHVTTALEKYTDHMKKLTLEDNKWQIEIHDYMAYYQSIKEVLKLRDQKQLDFEELSEYLQSTISDREKVVRGNDGGVTSFITGKLNEVRGVNMDKAKREKILRLDERVRELQEAIEQTHEVSMAFSDQVKKEDVFFNRNKNIGMYDVLKTYTDAKVDFYQNGVDIWREVVQLLEKE